MDVWDFVRLLVVAAVAAFGIRNWSANGFWLPGLAHVLAFLAGAVGLALGLLARWVDHPQADLHLWMAAGFPVVVYVVYILYNGASTCVRDLGDYLRYHARLDKAQIMALFADVLPGIHRLSPSDLLALNRTSRPIISPVARRGLRLFFQSELMQKDGHSYIVVEMWLDTSRHGDGRKFYASAEVVFSAAGDLIATPMDEIERQRTKHA
jgi:hypothetical protein